MATAIGVSQVHLSWTTSTDDVGVTGYLVERQDPGSPNFVQVGTTSAGTSYNDTGLVAGSAYSYRVRATDAAQNLSDYSAVASATTLAGNAASDNFNRADGALGANWTKPPASQNNLVIVNNQVGVDVEDTHNYAFWSADSFSQDQYSQVRIGNMGPWPGVIVQAQSAIDKFYLALVFAANDYRIYLRKDGNYILLSTGTTGDVDGRRHCRVTSGGVEPGATDVAPEWESGFDLHGCDREPRWREPGIGIYSPAGDHLVIDDWEGGELVH